MPRFKNKTSYAGRSATSDRSGQARFATNAENVTGTAADLIVSPLSMAGAVDDLMPAASLTVAGKVELATAGEMLAGTDEGRVASVKIAFDYINSVAVAGAPAASETVAGLSELSTDAETLTGTDTTRNLTPANLAAKLATPGAIGGGTAAAGSFTTVAATGAINFDAGGSFESGGATIDIGADASTDAMNFGTGAAARVITIGNVSGATQVVLNAGTAGIALASTGAGDITINSDDTLLLDADGVLEINSSAGVIGIGNDANAQNINIGTGAAARTITLGNSTDATSIVLDCGTGALNLGTNAIAHTVTIGNVTGATAIAINCGTGNFALEGNVATTYDISSTGVNTGTCKFASGTGARTVEIAGGGTGLKTVNIAAAATADVVTIGDATGAGSLDLVCGTGNMTLEGATAATYEISSTGVNTGTCKFASGTGARTVEIAGGGTGIKTLNIAAAATADVVTIGTSTGAGSLDLACGTGNFTLEGDVATTYDISSTGINTGTAKFASGTGARTVEIAGGGTGIKTVNIAAAATADVVTIGDSTGAGSLDLVCGTGNMTLEGATASTFEISSTGVNTGTCKFASGTGARTVEIAGGGTGVKTINIGAAATADVITIGTTTGAGSLTLAAGTGRMTVSGTVKEIDAEFLFSSGTDLTVTQSPVMTTAVNTGGVATGADGDVNLMYMQDGALIEQFIVGTQTIIAPRMSATGLDIELDNTVAEGAEYNFGARSNAKHAYTIGTSAAFFFEAQLTVEDLSGCAPLMIGFRKVEANNKVIADYTDYFCAGINTATSITEVVLLDELNGGGQTITNSTTVWTGGDTGTTTIRVLVSAAGVCTYTIDAGAPAVTNAVTFDNTDVVMPFIHLLNGADVAGAVSLNSLKCGFQA